MRVLATGESGYIARNLKERLERAGMECELRSIRNSLPSCQNFQAIVHLAAIVHNKKAGLEQCMKTNRDLSLSLAQKAKEEGVPLFVFMSTMSVYGIGSSDKPITPDTLPNPKTPYGISKLEAEKAVCALADSEFQVAVLRPPMVYGKNCPGNFSKLEKLVKILPIFPDAANRRSLVSIDNLCEYIKNLLDDGLESETKVLFPQDPRYWSSAELAKLIKPNILISKALGALARRVHPGPLEKLFGSLYYAQDMNAQENKEPRFLKV
ncbi:MAG: NAD-dependent epimerase/dehydratase family protein [Clostridiales bacterium]|nr:NAD-dependent epimerase/dehydratase family protein [Clostridiales bacterium]